MKDQVANVTRWILITLLTLSVLPGILYYSHAISTDFFLDWGYVMIALAILVLIIAPIYTIFKNPQNLLKMAISLIALIIVFAISYGIASNHLSPLQLETYKITAETSKLVGMGLYAAYITIALSILAIIYSAIAKIFK